MIFPTAHRYEIHRPCWEVRCSRMWTSTTSAIRKHQTVIQTASCIGHTSTWMKVRNLAATTSSLQMALISINLHTTSETSRMTYQNSSPSLISSLTWTISSMLSHVQGQNYDRRSLMAAMSKMTWEYEIVVISFKSSCRNNREISNRSSKRLTTHRLATPSSQLCSWWGSTSTNLIRWTAKRHHQATNMVIARVLVSRKITKSKFTGGSIPTFSRWSRAQAVRRRSSGSTWPTTVRKTMRAHRKNLAEEGSAINLSLSLKVHSDKISHLKKYRWPSNRCRNATDLRWPKRLLALSHAPTGSLVAVIKRPATSKVGTKTRPSSLKASW